MCPNEINRAGIPQDTVTVAKKQFDVDKQKLEKNKTNEEIQKELKSKAGNAGTTIEERNNKKVEDMSLEELQKLDEKITLEKLETRKAEIQKELKEKGDKMTSEDYIILDVELQMIDRQIVELKLKQKADVE